MMPPGMRILPGRQLRRPRRRIVRPEADADRGDRLEQVRAPRALRRARLRVLTQRRHVVEDPEAAAVRAGDEIGAQTRAVVLQLEVAHRDRRHVEPERPPVVAVVERHPHLHVGRRVEQPLLARILTDRVRRRRRGAMPVLISVHVLPPSCVRQKCGLSVVDAQRVRGRVRRHAVEVARLDVEDARPRLDRGRRDVRPLRAAVHRHLNDAVVGAGPDHLDVARRRRERGDAAQRRRRRRRSRTCRRSPARSHVCRVRSPLMRVQLCA